MFLGTVLRTLGKLGQSATTGWALEASESLVNFNELTAESELTKGVDLKHELNLVHPVIFQLNNYRYIFNNAVSVHQFCRDKLRKLYVEFINAPTTKLKCTFSRC